MSLTLKSIPYGIAGIKIDADDYDLKPQNDTLADNNLLNPFRTAS